ncbi:glycosyltransferase family 39 protein [Candidatus Woesearchaeota archaeon]|nr:glycosyltransferase family 39 protein [Candidatus Woesearchaeota archaeon]
MKETSNIEEENKEKKRNFLKISISKNQLILISILILAIVLRLLYAAEGVRMIATEFAREAFNIQQGLYDPNLIYFHIGIRYTEVVLYAIVTSLFGISEEVLFSVTFVISLLAIALAYFIGKRMFSEKVGLLAAFLMAILPMEIFNATVVESDPLMALFTGTALFLYYIAKKKQNKKLFFLAGILVALGFFTKIFAVLVIPILIVYEVLNAITKRENDLKKIVLQFMYMGMGFLLITLPVFVYQYSETGDFFYNIKVEKGIMHAITQFETWPEVKWDFPSEQNLLAYPRYMIKFIPENPWSKTFDEDSPMLHIYFILFFIILFFYVTKREKETDYLLCWILIPFLFLEGYSFIGKLQRYLTIIFVPLTILLSYLLLEQYERRRENKATKVWVILFFIGMIFITTLQLGLPQFFSADVFEGEHYHSSEELSYLVLKDLPEKDVYVTHYDQIPILSFYFEYTKNFSGPYGYHGPTKTSFYDLNLIKNLNEIEDAYVIVDPFYMAQDHENRDVYQYYKMMNGSLEYLKTETTSNTWIVVTYVEGGWILFYVPVKQ